MSGDLGNTHEPVDQARVVDKRARTRRVALGVSAVALVAVVAAVAWKTVAGRDHDGRQTTDAKNSMTGMDDMDGMDMSADGSVRLTANQLREFGVTFGTADVRTLQSTIRTTGVVTFDETRMSQVVPRFGGFVERLYVDFTGQPVRRGQPLLEIYSPALVAAQEELLIARRLEATMDQSGVPGVPAGSSNLLAAAMRRLRLWDISEAQIQNILQRGEVRRALTLHAPASGVVIEKNVVAGQAVESGQTLYVIADLAEVWVEAELQESDAGSVRQGSAATLDFAAFPGRPREGRVEYVYPTLQEASRTIKARIALANPDGRIKPGMFATVRFTSRGQSTLTVPAAAVIRTGERSVVFVDMGGGRLMPQDIETGQIGDGFIEVLAGLEPGQRVVTSAQFLLESESNIGEVMKAMMGMGGDMSDMSDMEGMKGMDMKGASMPGMSMPGTGKQP
jgi:multidrug efflux pump subunit AcrA (membrane-fusion protein)